ncbi:cAMP-binding domain of CRP or a regulatory subunit of cAMP-dependent protein kinases [Chitinophaga sp. YR627]|uniref:Crp/Fnr family transcriptional regulator n=1 Tax=Chitinophaga sp. YR627 TaxID=1881041 RepID=UPI0008F09A1C|nr:cyclic nucleotide-binding domain-containing protein [Chitinophaga sp. YR627]SFO77148.1 cAMP-binding domain of CRP or a regulatory subunit of cAMP-dependent protein kinases [Chitinophaga sp. YR627]
MDDLINYLLQYGQLNQQQIQLILDNVTERHLKRDEYFSEAGRIPREIGFIRSGILRVCYFNNKGTEITRYFVDGNRLISDIHSMESKMPSTEYIQAITDCEMIIFSENTLRLLSSTILDWDRIIAKIRERAMIEKLDKIAPMLTEDATSRYLMFMEKFPELANKVPLSYLASYLGITQSSLSRIRKQLSKQ